MTMMHTATIDEACTAGHHEGKPPDPLYTGPHCKCLKPGDKTLIDGEEYEVVRLIRDAGCPEHGIECGFVANPHEGASRGGKRL